MGIEVLIMGMSLPNYIPNLYSNTFAPETRNWEIVKLTKKIARLYNWGFVNAQLSIDSFHVRNNLPLSSTVLNWDQIHPNDLGHRLISKELSKPFIMGIPEDTFMLDDRFGGTNYRFNGTKTLLDLHNIIDKTNEFASYNIYSQQVNYGGHWQDNNNIPCADLYGTDVDENGNSSHINGYNNNAHIVADTNDWIEIEVENALQLWTSLTGTSNTTTKFIIYVDDIQTQELDISSTITEPIKIITEGTKINFLDTKKHKIRIERVQTIPSDACVSFWGFLVQYKGGRLSDKQSSEKRVVFLNRQIAQDNSLICSNDSWNKSADMLNLVQCQGQLALSYQFYGTKIQMALMTGI